jgi:hypothetical protein
LVSRESSWHTTHRLAIIKSLADPRIDTAALAPAAEGSAWDALLDLFRGDDERGKRQLGSRKRTLAG